MAERLPATRTAGEGAAANFRTARDTYTRYVKTHDVSAALIVLGSALDDAKANPGDAAKRAAVQTAVPPVGDYMEALRSYTRSGQEYFAAIRAYDDDLMAWTRSLGGALELLRQYTWPFVEHLKLYPPPPGQKEGYLFLSADDVQARKMELEQAASALAGAQSPSDGEFGAVQKAIDGVKEAGRSVEYVNSLHARYHETLTVYDGRVKEVVQTGRPQRLTPLREAFGVAGNLAVGAAILLGLAALLVRRRDTEQEVTA